jgi:hypothetical protein
MTPIVCRSPDAVGCLASEMLAGRSSTMVRVAEGHEPGDANGNKRQQRMRLQDRMSRELLADQSNDQLHRIHSLCLRAPCAGAWLIHRRWRVWRRVQHSLSREHRAWARANAAQMQLLDFGERNLRIFAHKFPRHTVARSGRAGAKRPKVRS